MMKIFKARVLAAVVAATHLFAGGVAIGPASLQASAATLPAARRAGRAAQSSSVSEISQGRISVKVERGDTVKLSNRFGRISVAGWENGTLEATARSERGEEKIQVAVAKVANHDVVTLTLPQDDKPDATSRRNSRSAQTSDGSQNERGASRRREIHLDVKLPRYAGIELIDARSSDVELSNLDAPVTVESTRGSVKASDIGSIRARTRNGEVRVERASAMVDVASASGSLSVSEGGADVRATSMSGDINIRCVKGFVEAVTTYGSITLNQTGPAEANTTNGGIVFKGAIRPDGRYRLKSLSGDVSMTIQENAPGFTSTLSSYAGKIETAFPLTYDTYASQANGKHRVGRYGSGSAQVVLDSFDGKVKLDAIAGSGAAACGNQ